MTKKAKDVLLGDVLNVNTGYRPLDDENCEVLKIAHREGLFGDPQICFFIKSYEGNHWYDVSPEDSVTIADETRSF